MSCHLTSPTSRSAVGLQSPRPTHEPSGINVEPRTGFLPSSSPPLSGKPLREPPLTRGVSHNLVYSLAENAFWLRFCWTGLRSTHVSVPAGQGDDYSSNDRPLR